MKDDVVKAIVKNLADEAENPNVKIALGVLAGSLEENSDGLFAVHCHEFAKQRLGAIEASKAQRN